MRTLLVLCLLTMPLGAEVLDRVAITIDQKVITESQIDEEIRVTSFLNRQPAQWTTDARRTAADRLIQQFLVEREMNLGHYPPPTDDEVQNYLDGLITAFGGPSAFNNALKEAKLNVDTLKVHLALQLTALRFIEYRFRPNFEITDEDIEAYRKRESKPSSREAVRETLIQQRTDEILAAWLEESRKQVNLVYLDTTLQ